jgi:phytoene dehydrogenase-like protein
VRGGRAVGVVTAGGTRHAARRAVLADVVAPSLFLDLVGAEHLPARFVDDLGRFQFDHGTVKVDWALQAPIPWRNEEAAGAGTVHLADSMDHLTMYAAELAIGRVPTDPFLILGQMAVADPTRSPTAWAYTHVPTSAWDEGETDRFADVIEARVERYAPGFRDCVLARHVFTPLTLEQANESLVGGAVNGGTAQLHQQLVFRPSPGLARPETPIAGLYLASSSAHPGGGVHGSPGANAARAALLRGRLRGRGGVRTAS